MSSNGTFVFMKSLTQIGEHSPSDLIPIHDGMVLSFINYELQINLEKKTEEELAHSQSLIPDVIIEETESEIPSGQVEDAE